MNQKTKREGRLMIFVLAHLSSTQLSPFQKYCMFQIYYWSGDFQREGFLVPPTETSINHPQKMIIWLNFFKALKDKTWSSVSNSSFLFSFNHLKCSAWKVFEFELKVWFIRFEVGNEKGWRKLGPITNLGQKMLVPKTILVPKKMLVPKKIH